MNTAIEDINSKQQVVSEHFWIGLHEGSLTWRWSLSDDGYYGDGEAGFRNWDVDQPHENPVIQHCVGIHHTGVWKDLDCDLSHYFLCYDGKNIRKYESHTLFVKASVADKLQVLTDLTFYNMNGWFKVQNSLFFPLK